MSKALLGEKVGMARLFDEDGMSVPVTIVKVAPNFVSQIKTVDSDGYDAIQLAAGEVSAARATLPMIGHDAKAGVAPQGEHREVRLDGDEVAEYEAGQKLDVSHLAEVKFVDVTAESKGKGYQGGMKRWGFAGFEASHGVERKHRAPGSIGGRASQAGGGRNKKGIKMAGQMGAKRVTVRNLAIHGVDVENGLLLIQGPVPGSKGGSLFIKESTRLWKRKARVAAAS